MSWLGLRTAIVSALGTAMTQVIDVKAHGGRIDRKEISRWATRSPAIRVAVLGVPTTEHSGVVARSNVRCAIFITTKGTSGTKRDADALNLAEIVTGHAINNLWNYSEADAPENVNASNLYSGKLDKETAVALWVVTWTQAADTNVPTDVLDNLYTVHNDLEVGPTDGVPDLPQTVQIRGTYMSYYGHIYASTSLGTAIAVSGTYQKLAGTTTAKLVDQFDMPDTGRLRHTGTVSRPCKVNAEVALSVNADATVTIALAKNGTVDEDTEIEQKITAAGGSESISVSGIVALDNNDYVEVWIKGSTTPLTVTAQQLNLVAAAT